MNKALIAALAVSTLFCGPALADGMGAPAGQNSFSLELRGFVPVICRAEVSATQVGVQSNQVSLGQLNEFCNDPNGYQVWVDYSPDLTDGALVVDGRRMDLTSAGSVMVSSSSQPSIAAHDLMLDLPSNGAQGSVSIRVVAL
jgi:hypothetical protein